MAFIFFDWKASKWIRYIVIWYPPFNFAKAVSDITALSYDLGTLKGPGTLRRCRPLCCLHQVRLLIGHFVNRLRLAGPLLHVPQQQWHHAPGHRTIIVHDDGEHHGVLHLDVAL